MPRLIFSRLSPCGSNLFSWLRKNTYDQRFDDIDKLNGTVEYWFESQNVDFYWLCIIG